MQFPTLGTPTLECQEDAGMPESGALMFDLGSWLLGDRVDG